MDKIYPESKEWTSELMNWKKIMDNFAADLPEYKFSSISAQNRNYQAISDIMGNVLPLREMVNMDNFCSVEKLTVPKECITFDANLVRRKRSIFIKSKVPEDSKLITHKKLANQKQISDHDFKFKNLTYSGPKPPCERTEEDLKINKDIVLHVKVYLPFKKNSNAIAEKYPKVFQDLIVLGHQTLEKLRDKLMCSSDLGVSVDFSENPDQTIPYRAKDIYRSGFFFINNVFYNDFRYPNCIDYSLVIRNWAQSKGIGDFQTALMDQTKFEDLDIKLGYPYVYQHQGNCEHLLIFTDIRFIHKEDCQSSSNYPWCHSVRQRKTARYCMACGFYIARWLVCKNERIPYDPVMFCEECFRSFNYVGGNKIGNFKAYPFYDTVAVI